MPSEGLAGRTVAIAHAYVGLQLLKTGPSAAPVSTAETVRFRWPCAFSRKACARLSKPTASERRDHNPGNSIETPRTTISPPERYVHTCGSTWMNTVDR